MKEDTKVNEYQFYTYRTSDGGDQIITIKAPSRAEAISEFNFIYGEHTPVDMIVERVPPFDTQKVGPITSTYLD
jgi:hypothetical protein